MPEKYAQELAAKRRKKLIVCEYKYCGKEVERLTRAKYCSKKCRDAAHHERTRERKRALGYRDSDVDR